MRFQQIKDLMLCPEQLHHQQGLGLWAPDLPRWTGNAAGCRAGLSAGGRTRRRPICTTIASRWGGGQGRPGWIRDSTWICWRSAQRLAAEAGTRPNSDSGAGVAAGVKTHRRVGAPGPECPHAGHGGTARPWPHGAIPPDPAGAGPIDLDDLRPDGWGRSGRPLEFRAGGTTPSRGNCRGPYDASLVEAGRRHQGPGLYPVDGHEFLAPSCPLDMKSGGRRGTPAWRGTC